VAIPEIIAVVLRSIAGKGQCIKGQLAIEKYTG
jgi:hypothetical protein